MPWIFLLLPWLELWTLIELGAATSALTALAYVFVTMMVGAALIRRQGEGMVARLREQAQDGLLNPQWLVDDLALVGAGVLLIIPGLITDSLAVIFLIAPLRRGLGRLLGVKMVQSGSSAQFTTTESEEHVTLEGEYRRLDDD
jgi:UPF0716 protein FxsA